MTVGKLHLAIHISQEEVRFETDLSAAVRFGPAARQDRQIDTRGDRYSVGTSTLVSKSGSPSLPFAQVRDTS